MNREQVLGFQLGVIAIISIIAFGVVILSHQAHADNTIYYDGPNGSGTINFDKCYTSQNHHCMSFSPQLNQAGGTNTHVTIHLPQNGAQVIDGILSPDNYTNLQQNPAVMSVQQIFTTTSSPTLHYCPNAKYILENQGVPEYLNHFYNMSKVPPVNITHFVYPDYCYVESGPNPIDGSNTPSVPEFGPLVSIILAIAVLSAIAITTKRGHKQ